MFNDARGWQSSLRCRRVAPPNIDRCQPSGTDCSPFANRCEFICPFTPLGGAILTRRSWILEVQKQFFWGDAVRWRNNPNSTLSRLSAFSKLTRLLTFDRTRTAQHSRRTAIAMKHFVTLCGGGNHGFRTHDLSYAGGWNKLLKYCQQQFVAKKLCNTLRNLLLLEKEFVSLLHRKWDLGSFNGVRGPLIWIAGGCRLMDTGVHSID